MKTVGPTNKIMKDQGNAVDQDPNIDRALLIDIGRAFATLRKNSHNSLILLSCKSQLPLLLIDGFENGLIDIEVGTLANLLKLIDSSFTELFDPHNQKKQP